MSKDGEWYLRVCGCVGVHVCGYVGVRVRTHVHSLGSKNRLGIWTFFICSV